MDAELRFFECGDGDTILIRGGDEWALVDAKLGESTLARLEKVMAEYNVTELRFVCVTHFDADHIRGLGSFLRRHFRSETASGRVRWHVRQFMLPLDYPDLAELLSFWEHLTMSATPAAASGERPSGPLLELLSTLYEIARDSDTARPRPPWPFVSYAPRDPLHEHEQVTRCYFGPWDVTILGPRRETVQDYWQRYLGDWDLPSVRRDDWLRVARRRVESNEISRILALRHIGTGETVLLPGDATAREIACAIEIHEDICRREGRSPKFSVVKASHHGACVASPKTNCHHAPLYRDLCHADETSIVISCLGRFGPHPGQNVLSDIETAQLPCHLTGSPIYDSDAFIADAWEEDVTVHLGEPVPHTVWGGRCGMAYLRQWRSL